MEQRYGFGQKLEPWKPYLAEGGRCFFGNPSAIGCLGRDCRIICATYGWTARLQGETPGDSYLELTLS